MKPIWCRKGQYFSDEVGTFRIPVMKDGWYQVINHYGNITVECWPGGFWWGWWRYTVRHKHE